MATHDGITIQSEALSLLDCCEGNFGEVLYRIAEAIAIKRMPAVAEVEVTAEDVLAAAAALVSAIEKSDLPAEARAWLQKMHQAIKSQVLQKSGR